LTEEHCDWLMDRHSVLNGKPHKNVGISCLCCFSVVNTMKTTWGNISSPYGMCYQVIS